MAETRARDLANLAGAGATSTTVAYHETARGFTLPAGAGAENQVIASDGDGTTQWKTTLSAPTVTSVTGSLNEHEGGVTEDGGDVTITGTNFGADASVLSVQISTDNFVTIVSTSSITIETAGTEIKGTFTGAETSYSTINAGETVKVKVTKSGLQSVTSVTLATAVTGDPTFTTTTAPNSTHSGTLATTSLGNYGGVNTGGGSEADTKLLLNFDRTGGTDFEDSSNTSGDGHKVIATNQAVIKASPFGDGKSAMFFDGVNDQLTLTSHADFELDASTAFTIEAWIYINSGNFATVLRTGATGASDGYHFGCIATSSTPRVSFSYGTDLTSLQDDVGLPLKTWTHIAVSREAGGLMRLFKDGILIKSATSTAMFGSSGGSTSYIGLGYRSSTATNDYQNGYLDEIRFVKGTAVYTSDFTVPTSRLTAIDNTKLLIHSNQEDDASDSKHTVTATGAISKTDQSKFGGSSWYFDGSDDYLAIPDHTDFEFGTGSFTIEFWIRHTSSPSNQLVIGFGNHTDDRFYIETAGSSVNTFVVNGGTTIDNNAYSVSLSINTWEHIALVRTSGVAGMKLYVDGTEKTASGGITLSATQAFGDFTNHYIGRYSVASSNYFTGYLDDIRITKGVAVYTGNFTAPTSALTKTWSASTGIAANSDASKVKLLIHGDGAKFTDNSDGASNQSTAHTITPTGAYHSQGHGGIVPVMAWPASGKATGSAGCYFDGTGDYLTITDTTSMVSVDYIWSLDFWVYPQANTEYGYIIDTRPASGNTDAIRVYTTTNGATSGGLSLDFGYALSSSVRLSTNLVKDTWTHVAIQQTGDGTNTLKCYFDGVLEGTVNGPNKNWGHGGASSWTIGSRNSDSAAWYLKGYIDSLRVCFANDSFTGAFDKPTKIYGSIVSQNVGTIQLNASTSPATTIDYAELSGGTALSTYGLSLSTSGAITGDLTGLATSQSTNSGGVLRIRARGDANDNRLTTLGGGSYTSITQNAGGAPVLFNERRYIGNDLARDINGFGFKPDLVWFKERDDANFHQVFDSVRGKDRAIYPNGTNVEGIRSNADDGQITSFNSDGFSLSTDINNNGINQTGAPMIAWGWKAGGKPSTDGKKKRSNSATEDSLTSGSSGDYYRISEVKQSVNVEGDFSITRYKGSNSGSNDTFFKHGLSGKPDFTILKRTDGADKWICWHKDGDSGNTGGGDFIVLNESEVWGSWNGSASSNNFFGASGLTSTHYYLPDTGSSANDANQYFIVYAWKAVDKVSAFGSYEGSGGAYNSSTGKGGVTDMGFKPRFLLIKNIDAAANWALFSRAMQSTTATVASDPDGTWITQLYANEPDDEDGHAQYGVIPTSTGFEMTASSSDGSSNTLDKTYIYAAFA